MFAIGKELDRQRLTEGKEQEGIKIEKRKGYLSAAPRQSIDVSGHYTRIHVKEEEEGIDR